MFLSRLVTKDEKERFRKRDHVESKTIVVLSFRVFRMLKARLRKLKFSSSFLFLSFYFSSTNSTLSQYINQFFYILFSVVLLPFLDNIYLNTCE